ncbi:hypothetical protein [Psychrobacter urativorans]|uniref:hypothetical protein n=1 Tax=Psychrobacter urativorans TaxID=45610 RepID=UPI003BB591C6
MLAMILLVFFMPLVTVIHLIATISFQRNGLYKSKSFTIKHLAVALLFPIAGMALITFEYIINLRLGGIDVESYLLILSPYALLTLIFATPYFLHLWAVKKS